MSRGTNMYNPGLWSKIAKTSHGYHGYLLITNTVSSTYMYNKITKVSIKRSLNVGRKSNNNTIKPRKLYIKPQ